MQFHIKTIFVFVKHQNMTFYMKQLSFADDVT